MLNSSELYKYPKMRCALSTFKEFNLIQERQAYFIAIDLIESNQLNEGILDMFGSLKSKIQSKIEFFQALADISKQKLEDLVVLFKDSRVFKFFQHINFNLKFFFDLIKKGFKVYNEVQKAIAQYVSESKIGKFTQDKMQGLDAFLKNHPVLKRISGIAVAGLLLYIWMNMSYTGDFSYDFDFSDILSSLSGNFSLETLFAGTDGTRLLLLFATGLVGLSFPWPGPSSVQMVVSLLMGLKKLIS